MAPGMSTTTSGALGVPPIHSPAGFQAEQPKSLLRFIHRFDPVVMFMWVLSTMVPLAATAPLRYFAAGYFAFGLFLFARQTMPVVARCWPLFLLPILCTISALWAPSSGEALRKGMLLALTGLVPIYAATRLTGRTILLVYFIVELGAAIISIPLNKLHEGAWTGLFDQKNFFAINMFILYVASLTLSLDKENPAWLRLLALAAIPLSMFLILMAQSGTTTALMLAATVAMLAHTMIWKPAAKLEHARTFLFAVIVIAALLGAYICIGILQIDIKGAVLEALGKDSTLTGRTMLWDVAQRQMHDHPWTGLGANGYWRGENGTANTITNMIMGSERFTSFSFHNSYLENGTNYGYPGYIATAIVVGWACISAAITWARNQSVVNSAFLVLALLILLRTFSEAELAIEFSGAAVLLFIAGVRREKLPGKPIKLSAIDYSGFTRSKR